eukprot:scaffold1248_cov170-Amphora_coffeaeformis.AAC.7
MSLLGIAIVGKKNEPLYLCDCTKLANEMEESPAAAPPQPHDDDDNAVQDPFGFLLQNNQSSTTTTKTLPQGQSLEMEQQFILHAALDRLEEQVGASNPDGTMPLRKAVRNNPNTTITAASATPSSPTTTKKSVSRPAQGTPPNGQWLGLLTVQDGSSVLTYGYVTATNLKFLALTEHPSSSSRESLQQQGLHVRTLCRTLHQHYVRYLMNPFQALHETRLESATLDKNIRQAVQTYHASMAQDKTQK